MLVAAPNLSGASAGNTLSAQAQRLVESSFGGSKIGAMHKVTVLNSRCVADSNTSEQSSPSKAQLPLAQVVEIVAAIYRLEGGDKTKYPYGIRSIDTHGDKALAKRICENTVRNNYKRWIKAGGKGDYLDYLANVYCPPSADKQGNINWKRNIHKMVKWTL